MVKLHLDPLFGSAIENHRLNIRKHIVENHSLTEKERLCILDVSRLPKSEKYFFSIAHCKSIGGYAVSDIAVGFDIEELERIQPEAVKRISMHDAIPKDPRYLWVAKESLVKLTSAKLISECRVTKWSGSEFQAEHKGSLLFGSVSFFEKYIQAASFKKT